MATVDKAFRIKNGLIVEGSTATVNSSNVLTEASTEFLQDTTAGMFDGSHTGISFTYNDSTGKLAAAVDANPSFTTSITFEGATADAYETTLEVTDPTADRTIILPDVSGTVVTTGDTGSVTNTMLAGSIANSKLSNSAITINGTSTSLGGSRTLGSDDISEGSTNKYFTDERAQDAIGNSVGTGLSYNDSTGAISVDTATIQARVSGVTDTEIGYLDGVTSAIQTQLDAKASASSFSTHTAATDAHGATGAVVGTTNTQTLTNKTLTSPTVSGLYISDGSIVLEGASADAHETTLTVTDPTADRTITFPDATGTVALTGNKLSVFAATSSSELAGVLSDETGTGALVFANTPTLVTPNIGAATGTSLVLSGDLTINGTTTTVNSTTLVVDDKNITLGDVATPSDITADGGGLTLKGATDKTINWVDATDSWTLSEHLDLASGKVLKIAGTQVLSATEYTGNAATVTNGITTATTSLPNVTSVNSTSIPSSATLVVTTDKLSVHAATSSSELAGVISDETGTGALVFANTPTLVTPVLGAATGTSLSLSGSITLADALIGTATQSLTNTSATVVDSWAVADYSSAKYIVQMKNGNDIEVLEVLVTTDANNNVYITEYADVISNAQIGTTDADYSAGNVRLKVTASNNTTVKVHKTLIEA